MLVAFYEASISLRGMQLSAPPGRNGLVAGELEINLPNVVYYRPVNTPPPAMVGELPVPAEEFTWDGRCPFFVTIPGVVRSRFDYLPDCYSARIAE